MYGIQGCLVRSVMKVQVVSGNKGPLYSYYVLPGTERGTTLQIEIYITSTKGNICPAFSQEEEEQ